MCKCNMGDLGKHYSVEMSAPHNKRTALSRAEVCNLEHSCFSCWHREQMAKYWWCHLSFSHSDYNKLWRRQSAFVLLIGLLQTSADISCRENKTNAAIAGTCEASSQQLLPVHVRPHLNPSSFIRCHFLNSSCCVQHTGPALLGQRQRGGGVRL